MAQQPVNIGGAVNDNTGDPFRTAFTKLNANDTELYALQSQTINAAAIDFAGAGSNENKITAAIAAAVTAGAARVFVPAAMLPYDASLVSFDDSIQMVREGGSFDSYDIQAYGAAMDGVTDATVAIQAAIDAVCALGVTILGGLVYLPPGRAAISATLTVPQNKHVSFSGTGRNSALLWIGGNNDIMLHYVGGNAGPDCKAYVEKIGFVATGQTGIVAIASGSATVNFGMINFSVKQCTFQGVDIALETFTETDELVFEDNWLLAYYVAGVRATGGGSNSNFHIKHNHFQGGTAGTWALDHTGGANVEFEGNTVQSGSAGLCGVRLNTVGGFRFANTYFEVNSTFGATDGPMLALEGCTDGVIEINHSTGDTGNYPITIDATCDNIRIGPNNHGVSGGTPLAMINIASGATNIWIMGKQTVTGGSFLPYVGAVSMYAADEVVTTAKPVNHFNGNVNVASPDSADLFTIPPASAYLVYMKSASDSVYALAIANRTASGGAMIFAIKESSANLVFAPFGIRYVEGKAGKKRYPYSTALGAGGPRFKSGRPD